MGYKVSFVEFKDGLPEIGKILEILIEKTRIEVEHSTIGYGSHCFSFNPKKDKVPNVSIGCCFYSRQNTIKVEFQSGFDSESLNKYPNYFHFSLVSTLVELGGKASKELPFYSNFSWQDWVKLNGSPTPNFLKVFVFQSFATCLAFIIVPFVWLFLIGFSCFCWVVDCYNDKSENPNLLVL